MENEKEEVKQGSPIPQQSPPTPIAENTGAEPVKMSFTEALAKTVDGARINKVDWNDENFYGIIVNNILKLHKPDGKLYDWILSLEDINGNDWVVLKEVGK